MCIRDRAEIERRAHSLFGKMRVEPGRGVFPLAVETAHSFARERIALVGEAAHVVPPIGAQGLNLGLRDAAALAELVADARRQNGDVGAPAVLARYDAERRADATSRRIAIDLLNRSLLTDFLPVQGVRGLSLYLVDRIGPVSYTHLDVYKRQRPGSAHRRDQRQQRAGRAAGGENVDGERGRQALLCMCLG